MENPPKMYDNTPFFQTTTARLLMVGFLCLFLLIPLQLVRNLIFERSDRQREVVKEITQKWGDSVMVYGPVVKVPYTVRTMEKRQDAATKKEIFIEHIEEKAAYFFPDRLENVSKADTRKRSRGNYESIVYTVGMKFKGTFTRPSLTAADSADTSFHWEKATLLVCTTDLKGIRNELAVRFDGRSYGLAPTVGQEPGEMSRLESGYLGADFIKRDHTDFSFDITYNGSNQIRFVPVGRTTSVSMTSNWKTPGFQGNFIPADHTIDATTGFAADWKVLPVSRPFSSHYFGQLPNLDPYAFGVDFVVPVDEYLQNDRASKYGFLVIGLTFLVFFLMQTINKIGIHIFQYAMIGVALVMFYTLLISITEHSSFSFAYAIASAAVVVLISLYSLSILKEAKRAVFICLSLSTVYAFIFVIIQLEDYALLVGSIGLFAILAAVMYFSRKIEWKN